MADNVLPNIGQITSEVIDGLQIRVSRSGKPGLPAVLFTSPWPESIYAFHRVLPHFTASYSVVTIDLPGFGHSESRPDVMSPMAMGRFLAKAAAHLNLSELHGVGPDVGALAFLFAAAEHPNLFKSLAVGGAATRVDLAGGRLKDLVASPSGTFSAVDGADAVSDYLAEAGKMTPSAIIDDFREASAGRRFEEAVQYVRAYKADLPLLEKRLSLIKTPVLVISGRNDPIVPPSNSDFLADRLLRNHLSLLDAAHRVWEEAAEAYATQVSLWAKGEFDRRLT